MIGGFKTAIQHDDTKALSAAKRAELNAGWRRLRDQVRKFHDEVEGKCES